MISFLTNWLRNRKREIFWYWDGTKECRIDPMVVWRRLKDCPNFNLDDDPEQSLNGIQDATDRCRDAAYFAFGLTPLSQAGGVTETEALDVLAGFFVWVAELKKNSSGLPIPPATTGPSPPSPGNSDTTTKPPAVYSSTPGGQSYGLPGPLLTG